MEFVKDCLSRKMSLRDVATKWNITSSSVMDKYHEERSKLTEKEVERIMNEVYLQV